MERRMCAWIIAFYGAIDTNIEHADRKLGDRQGYTNKHTSATSSALAFVCQLLGYEREIDSAKQNAQAFPHAGLHLSDRAHQKGLERGGDGDELLRRFREVLIATTLASSDGRQEEAEKATHKAPTQDFRFTDQLRRSKWVARKRIHPRLWVKRRFTI